MGDGAMARYEGLGIREALRRSYDYAGACTELGFVMRGAYSKLPKNLQLAVFQDTLSAFRLLPDVQTSAGLSSAHALHQASEASLPKQRKAAATSEFRRAVVSQKRRCRVQEEDEGSRQLPEDIMVNIFSYLDLKSLACASLVSRLWNSAANDYSLWGLQYSLHFGDYESTKESLKASFKQKYMGCGLWKSSSLRVYCTHCGSIMWATSLCKNTAHRCSRFVIQQRPRLKSISPNEIVKYILGDPGLEDSDSSDGDSDEFLHTLPRLWALPSLSGQ